MVADDTNEIDVTRVQMLFFTLIAAKQRFVVWPTEALSALH
jgi:hypothetical protein